MSFSAGCDAPPLECEPGKAPASPFRGNGARPESEPPSSPRTLVDDGEHNGGADVHVKAEPEDEDDDVIIVSVKRALKRVAPSPEPVLDHAGACFICLLDTPHAEASFCYAGHVCHTACLGRYVKVVSKRGVDGTLTVLACDHGKAEGTPCGKGFPEREVIVAMPDPKIREEVAKLETEKAVLNSTGPEVVHQTVCCGALGLAGKQQWKAKCPDCGKEHCIKCGIPWVSNHHRLKGGCTDQAEEDGSTLGEPPADPADPEAQEQAVVNAVERILTNAVTTICPRPACRKPVMRESGCSHITCSICDIHFCFTCRMSSATKTAIYNHFCEKPDCDHSACCLRSNILTNKAKALARSSALLAENEAQLGRMLPRVREIMDDFKHGSTASPKRVHGEVQGPGARGVGGPAKKR
ncbi:hypothetical protein DFJ74DRAFT_693785 [Hyaloraphidium curvatum]|nr:hypothetical protein DFJ74DRAFT_693785 [Hyaloraphidium curvatum]